MSYVINFTGRSHNTWSKEQQEEISKYGEIVDIKYPNVNPNLTMKQKSELINEYVESIKEYEPSLVLCGGEMITTYNFVNEFKELEIPVCNATTKRESIEHKTIDKETGKEITEKQVVFNFVGLRPYFDEKRLYSVPEEIKEKWDLSKNEREKDIYENDHTFLTISNHDVKTSWSDEQIKSANEIGYIEQIKFPNIEPELSREEMNSLMDKTLNEIVDKNPSVVHIQGESIFTMNMVNALRELEIPVVSATTELKEVDGKKIFSFKDWQTYDLTGKDERRIEEIKDEPLPCHVR